MVHRRLAELKLAFMLFTRFPVGRLKGTVPDVGASGWAWPLAGFAVAVPASLVYLLLYTAGLGAQVSAFGLVATLALCSGAMHEDGLADMADGFGGGRSKDQKLDIMRDSRIGSYGVLALIFAVAIHVSLIARLQDPSLVIPATIGLSMASRGCLPFWLRWMPPARQDGLGQTVSIVSRGTALASIAIGFAGLLAVGLLAAIVGFCAVMACGAAVSGLAMKQIGGQTGDVMGSIQKLSEIAGWAVITLLMASTS